MAVSPFERAHYQKVKLTEQTAKRIELIYRQSAQDISRQLRNFRIVNPSDSLKKVYLENLLKDITKSQESFNRLVEQTIRKAGEDAGNLAVNAANDAMGKYGLKMRGAYSYIPRQQVGLIASGKLYGDKWSLSSAIWKNGLRTKSDIQNMVAKGLVENKPIKDIADDITKYVDPTARKPWDWNKVYPGTAAKVDYNAQRLARTMIQHSFQASMVQAQLHNPFCKGIIWHSVGLHGRTCEQCLERDGQMFPVKDLPLDHPNGLCYFEPALDSMNDIADRLANWVNGGSDPGLDSYVANAFGLSPKSLTGQKAVGAVKRKTRSASSKAASKAASKTAEKSSRPTHKISTGRDITKSYVRRREQFKFEIEDVINRQGFDGLPRVVSSEEFEAAVKESKFIAQRTYSAETKEILDEYRKMLYDGKWYVDCGTGGAQYGQGMYCAADYTGNLSKGILEEMKHYQELGRARKLPLAYTETLTLDPSAKIIEFSKLEREFKAYNKTRSLEGMRDQALDRAIKDLKVPKPIEGQYRRMFELYGSATTPSQIKQYDSLVYRLEKKRPGSTEKLKKDYGKYYGELQNRNIKDIGSFAVARGYDAINAVGHGESGSYTVILNRTKLIIKRGK